MTKKNSHNELILVTGGAGFIGAHLVDRLIVEGYRVRVLDNLGAPTHNRKLPEWFNKQAEFQKGDVRNKKDWLRALKGVSYVFHLAAYMDFHLDFSTYVDTNTKSTALLFETIVEEKLPVQQIIAASSQAVYGEGSYRCAAHGLIYPLPRGEAALQKKEWELRCPECGETLAPVSQRETDQLHPTIPYGISKQASEELLFCLGRMYGIPSVALRYTIVHGARQSFRHFHSGALRQISVMALSHEPLVLHEDGQQMRDYVNVHDVVDAHLTVLENPKAFFEAFNVGRGEPTRIRELAEVIKKEAGSSSDIHAPGLYRIGAPRHSPSDNAKLRALGWVPRRTLLEGVREYIAWIQQFPEAKKFFAATLLSMREKKLLR